MAIKIHQPDPKEIIKNIEGCRIVKITPLENGFEIVLDDAILFFEGTYDQISEQCDVDLTYKFIENDN